MKFFFKAKNSRASHFLRESREDDGLFFQLSSAGVENLKNGFKFDL